MHDNQTFQTGGTVDINWPYPLAANCTTYPYTTTAGSWTISADSIGLQNCSANYEAPKIESLGEKINNLQSQIDYLMDMLQKILDRYTEKDVISLLDGIKKPKDGAHENNDHDDP